MDEDLVLALQLQEEWNLQVSEREPAQEPLSLVDASWELVDPTPDIQALFVLFNDRFFWGQLEAVEVKWSMRMTLWVPGPAVDGAAGGPSVAPPGPGGVSPGSGFGAGGPTGIIFLPAPVLFTLNDFKKAPWPIPRWFDL